MIWNITPSREEVALLMEAGFIYRDARKFEEAREIFHGVNTLLPNCDVVEVALGTVSFHQGDFYAAVEHYKKALLRNPGSAYAEAHLGEAYLFLLDKKKASRRLARAVELDPEGDFGRMARSALELVKAVEFKEDVNAHAN